MIAELKELQDELNAIESKANNIQSKLVVDDQHDIVEKMGEWCFDLTIVVNSLSDYVIPEENVA